MMPCQPARRSPAQARATITPIFRTLACLAVLALLSACASQRPQVSALDEAHGYAAHAKRNYAPPGPPGDPWGPFIVEAANRYDVPERWVRGVMRQESGGQLYENGQLIISSAGAMGLMQVMPSTYDELRGRYSLGDDPYDPHDNIMAGVAYLREMYNVYGSPGFLAAYNAGPGRLDDYLTRNKPLPEETRRYVARVGRAIAGSEPQMASAAEQVAMYRLPLDIPSGPRYPRGRSAAPVALADNRSGQRNYGRVAVQAASLPEPPRSVPPPVMVASATPRHGLHLISPAMADTMPAQHGGPANGAWAIQVGAFGNPDQARAATDSARGQAGAMLRSARATIGSVRQAKATLYRARLTGLSREAAVQACQKLSHGHTGCIVLSPETQS
jgi:cell division septation protein DedD